MHPKPASPFPVLRAKSLMAALLLSACGTSEGLDWDMRSDGIDTSGAVIAASDAPPRPDARGVISYPTYQVAVAQRGDTVTSLAARVGLPATELAGYNALRPEDPLRPGEVLALPTRVASAAAPTSGSAGSSAGSVDVAAIATSALDSLGTTSTAAAPASGAEPARHQVKRGETAFSIARTYGVSAKALADWNGLDADLSVREGQFLIIPTASSTAPPFQVSSDEAPPGAGSPTPEPPSARAPLPDAETTPAAAAASTPAAESPDLGSQRTAASATKMTMPVAGSIIRGYLKGKNEGIDIAATAGAPVLAAEAGIVAAITTDTSGTPIVVIKHADNLLTVYAGVDGLKVAKGATVTRGQTIAVVKAGDPAFLHFEVRRGVESLDPMTYLQ